MTNYRLAKGEDIPKLVDQYALEFPLEFPTVVADHDGEFRGMLGTTDDEFLISGPFYADSPMVMIKLLKAYRNVMRLLGVESYYFSVEKTNKDWLAQVRRLSMMKEREEFETDELIWFETSIDYPYGIKYKFPKEVH